MAKEKKHEFAVRLLGEYCKGCRLCISVCEAGKIAIDPAPNERGIQTARLLRHRRCSGCLRCTAICPEAAIEIDRLETDQTGAQNDERPRQRNGIIPEKHG